MPRYPSVRNKEYKDCIKIREFEKFDLKYHRKRFRKIITLIHIFFNSSETEYSDKIKPQKTCENKIHFQQKSAGNEEESFNCFVDFPLIIAIWVTWGTGIVEGTVLILHHTRLTKLLNIITKLKITFIYSEYENLTVETFYIIITQITSRVFWNEIQSSNIRKIKMNSRKL